MAQETAIEWADVSWNPVHGCSKVSPGCAHCYAETLSLRRGFTSKPWEPGNATENVVLKPHKLEEPLRSAKPWDKPRRVFVNSMSDLFHERLTGLPMIRYLDGRFTAIPGSEQPRQDGEPPRPDFIAAVFAVMSIASQHTFQVLTKRPEAMMMLLTEPNFWLQVNAARLARGVSVLPGGMSEWATTNGPALPNVWLGTSIENRRFVHRAHTLRLCPAAVRFVSAEPLLGPLDRLVNELPPEPRRQAPQDAHIDDVLAFERAERKRPRLPGIDWLIVGGESGAGHRPIDPAWVRTLRDACQEGGGGNFCSACSGEGARIHDLETRERACEDCEGRGWHGTAFLFKQWGGATSKSGGRKLDGRTWDDFPGALGAEPVQGALL